MLHSEIYVDGLATMNIQNINELLNSITMEIIQKYNPDPNDLHLNTLKQSCINEDEYFFHTIHNDLDIILRTIRENHQFDIDSAPIEPTSSASEIMKRFLQAMKTTNNPSEAYWLCSSAIYC